MNIQYAIIQLKQIIQIIQIDNFERREAWKMQLNFSGKQDVYLEVAARFKEYIKLGIYKNGDKLPSVREAAGELGVNPNTIARAYATLEKEGLICSLPKKGAFVTYGKEEAAKQPDKRSVIAALRDMGIEKQTLIDWIEEVYGEC